MRMACSCLMLIWIVLLVGCQIKPRQYDGVLGYKITSNLQGKVKVLCVEEDRKSWDKIKKRVMLVCADELNLKPNSVGLEILKQEQFSQDIDMALSIPMMVGSSSTINSPNSGSGIVSSSNIRQSLVRTIKLKSLLVECWGL